MSPRTFLGQRMDILKAAKSFAKEGITDRFQSSQYRLSFLPKKPTSPYLARVKIKYSSGAPGYEPLEEQLKKMKWHDYAIFLGNSADAENILTAYIYRMPEEPIAVPCREPPITIEKKKRGRIEAKINTPHINKAERRTLLDISLATFDEYRADDGFFRGKSLTVLCTDPLFAEGPARKDFTDRLIKEYGFKSIKYAQP